MNYKIALCDTDSLFFFKSDQSIFTKEERVTILNKINESFPQYIKFSDNGYYNQMFVIKSKNYVMVPEGKPIKIKGSALLATGKEQKFQQFIKDVINLFLEDKQSEVITLYNRYVKEILILTDISQYCSKKTITSKVLNPERTNEQKVFDAIEDSEGVQEGDKIRVYFDKENKLKLQEHWNNDHNEFKLLEKLYKTALIFSNVLDKKQFINYSLKTKRKLLEML